ncbi:MAG: response regulator [Deltaproteobacteria bacterium]|nr:response regulator [Deltaproteobacteria bacterium]
MPRKILIVEDHEDIRQILRFVLQPLGYQIVEAADGIQGINKALAERPNLIIMDLGLPGIDGIEATWRLKQDPRTAPIPVIAYTIWSEDFRERAMAAGIAEFLRKTEPPHVLKQVIERLLPRC